MFHNGTASWGPSTVHRHMTVGARRAEHFIPESSRWYGRQYARIGHSWHQGLMPLLSGCWAQETQLFKGVEMAFPRLAVKTDLSLACTFSWTLFAFLFVAYCWRQLGITAGKAWQVNCVWSQEGERGYLCSTIHLGIVVNHWPVAVKGLKF